MTFSIDRFRRKPPSQFVYKKLGCLCLRSLQDAHEWIRLIYLVPNRHNPDQLHVRIFQVLMPEVWPLRYQALSYVWGKPIEEEQKPEILCSYEFSRPARMRITPNLHAALAAIRPSKRFPMWVDALCINQADNGREKEAQIAMMHFIYSRAKEVVIWFHPSVKWQDRPIMHSPGTEIHYGPIPDGTEVAIELCRWLMAYMEDENVDFDGFPKLLRRFATSCNDPLGRPSFTPEQVRRLARFLKDENRLWSGNRITEMVADIGLPSYHDRIWTFLDQLFGHAWSSRTWTFQEVILAKKSIVRSGDCSIDWQSFLYIFRLFRICFGWSLPGVHAYAAVDGRAGAAANFLSPFFMRLEEEKDDILWFMTLLTHLRIRDVTEPVDRIYGVLALASPRLRAKIPIDYSETARKQYWRLYTDLAQMAIVSGHASLVLRAVNPNDRLPDLPSWCPDYNVKGLMIDSIWDWPIGRAGFFDSSTTNIIEPSLNPALIRFGGFSVDTITLVLDFPIFDWSFDSRSLSWADMVAKTLGWLRQIEQIIEDNVIDSGIVPTIFWQCMFGYIPPATDEREMIAPARSKEGFALFMLYLNRSHAGLTYATGDVLDEGQHDLFQTVWSTALNFFNGKRFFLTEKGHFGWGIVGTRAGDNVCVFLGEKVLYLLTPPETKTVHGKLDSYREFRSPAYVHGMMMGEALKDVKEGEHEIFNIM